MVSVFMNFSFFRDVWIPVSSEVPDRFGSFCVVSSSGKYL